EPGAGIVVDLPNPDLRDREGGEWHIATEEPFTAIRLRRPPQPKAATAAATSRAPSLAQPGGGERCTVTDAEIRIPRRLLSALTQPIHRRASPSLHHAPPASAGHSPPPRLPSLSHPLRYCLHCSSEFFAPHAAPVSAIR
ncbi:hypothetical protein Dimus_030647, partial [Dionaea muscipula]